MEELEIHQIILVGEELEETAALVLTLNLFQVEQVILTILEQQEMVVHILPALVVVVAVLDHLFHFLNLEQ